uniref:DUF4455 domain-containing protein n=1 Tax=Cyprinus carpio TaxID=7962 RepID=A0A8C2HRW6_CYPCA
MHDIWNKVCYESSLKRKWIKELDEIYAKYESERKAMVCGLYYVKHMFPESKISYLMPCDVHRLIDSEAMMINQALLANQHALAKLCLNLMEKHLQMDISQRLRWEEKLQDWKQIKLNDTVTRFRDVMNSPHIQNPKNIQDTLSTLKSDQKTQRDKHMKPPRISKSSVAEWFSALSVINEQIDCIHIATMEKLHKNFENNWQVCLAEVDLFKVSTYGFTTDEIQNIVNVEILPLIGQRQSQTEIYLEKLDVSFKAFECLAKTAAYDSKCLFKFMCGAAQLWENHCAGMLNREQQLQSSLESLSQVHELENQARFC